MAGFIARRDDGGLFVVSRGQRWWTVHFAEGKPPYILNENLRQVKSDGQLGRQILRACRPAR